MAKLFVSLSTKDALLKYELLPSLVLVFIVLCQIVSPAPSPWDLLYQIENLFLPHEVPPTAPGLGYW